MRLVTVMAAFVTQLHLPCHLTIKMNRNGQGPTSSEKCRLHIFENGYVGQVQD